MRFFKNNDPKKRSPFTKDHFSSPYIHIENYTYGLPTVMHWGEMSHLHIGKFCSIAEKVILMLGGNHRGDWITTYPFNAFSENFPDYAGITGHPSTKGDIIIGNDVWLGFGTTVLSGVTIGDGAIVGANSVVSKSVPPYAIVVGNPGRIVKYRFSQDVINELIEIKWWLWTDEKINSYSTLICQPDIKKFIEKAKSEER